MHAVGVVIAIALQLYMYALVARMLLSWVSLLAPGFTPRGPVLVLFEGIYSVTDPPVRLFTRLLPDVRVGGVSFSLGFLAAWAAILVAMQLNTLIFLR